MPVAIPLAIVAGSVISGAISADAAKSAAADQAAAAGNATQTQWNEYQQTRSDQAPWRTAGSQALGALSQWYGLGGLGSPTAAPPGSAAAPASGGGTGPNGEAAPPGYSWVQNAYGVPQLQAYGGPNSGPYRPTPQGGIQQQIAAPPGTASSQPAATGQTPNFSQIIQNLPGYQFQFQQGQQAVGRNLAAAGLANSGAAGKALTQYGQDFASNYANSYINGLQSLAGLGQTATQATTAAGINAANQISGNQIYAGNAAATGTVGQANAINSGLQGLVSSYGQYQQAQNQLYNQQYDNLQPFTPTAQGYLQYPASDTGTTTYYGGP